jgi:hypothetical protein
MSRVLVLLSGYPCARSPWGNSQNHGTPDLSSFNSFYTGAEYLKKLLRGHLVDYICTTWDDVGEDQIRRTYEPIIYKSYSQNQFRDEIDEVLHSYELERMGRRTEYYREHGLDNNLVVSSIRFASQLQSRCNAAKLALDSMGDVSNSYDAILLTRYDISTRGGFLVRHPTFLDDFDFSFLASSVDEPKFIIPSFGQLNCGFPDMWLYMNSAGLRHYALIADNYIRDITSSSSEYFKMMTEGWPFSRKFSMHSIYDYRQYSNEMLKVSSHPLLMSYPEWEVSNLHSYHKYFLYLSSALPMGSKLRLKNWFDVSKAFLVNSKLISNIKPLFFEMLSYSKFSLKIFWSRLTERG